MPIEPSLAEEFDPEAVPTIQQLLKELKLGAHSTTVRQPSQSRWRDTTLKPHMVEFERLLRGLVADSTKALHEKARQAAAKPSLAW